jgi:hypothetical protein
VDEKEHRVCSDERLTLAEKVKPTCPFDTQCSSTSVPGACAVAVEPISPGVTALAAASEALKKSRRPMGFLQAI